MKPHIFFLFTIVLGSLSCTHAAKCSTSWASISSALPGTFSLPTVPSVPLPSGLLPAQAAQQDGYMNTYAGDSNASVSTTDVTCALSGGWNPQFVSVGPLLPYSDNKNHCRVTVATDATRAFMFRNKYPLTVQTNVSNLPVWVTARFPIPEGHEARYINYNVAWTRLFGGRPANCSEFNAQGCIRYTTPGWQDDVPAGFFILWGNPADAAVCGGNAGWEITGPHDPLGTLTFGWDTLSAVDVPLSMRNVSELVVTFLVFNQYPGGCSASSCSSGRSTYHSVFLSNFGLKTWKKLSVGIPRPPHTGRPRLLASFPGDPSWEPTAKFNQLVCNNTQRSEWGTITNVKNQWDVITLGGANCSNSVPKNITQLPFTSMYFSGAGRGGDNGNGRKTLHLLRRLKECYGYFDGQTLRPNAKCAWSLDALKQLQARFIDVDVSTIVNASFVQDAAVGFDLQSNPPFFYWSFVLDTLWGDLNVTVRNAILAKMSPQIDKLILNSRYNHWSVQNGNNWTPILCTSAIAWAITMWHEDPRAADVTRYCLDKMWLHSRYWESDGSYHEGMSYSGHGINAILSMQAMVRQNLGRNLDSHPWTHMTNYGLWMINNMLPDGKGTDFGDSHILKGFDFLTLTALYWDQMLNRTLFTTPAPAISPCLLSKYWINRYFTGGMEDPWFIPEFIARDWVADSKCPNDMPPEWTVNGTLQYIWPNGWGGQFRVIKPGTTQTAKLGPQWRYKQADQVSLSISAVPGNWAHMDLDFSTIIWTVYGARLLWDFSYGIISGPNTKYSVLDRIPLGHNVLNIPEALDRNKTDTNTAQIDGSRGSITQFVTPGNIKCFDLDGSHPYGRLGEDLAKGTFDAADSQSLGWLNDMHRYMCSLGNGSTDFLIIDSFVVRQDRPAILAQEFFHSRGRPTPTQLNNCTSDFFDSPSVVINSNTLHIYAICNSFATVSFAESAGSITAASAKPGGFVQDPQLVSFKDITQTWQYFYRTRYIPTNPVRSDVRAFLFRASTSVASLPSSNLTLVSCGEGKVCFEADLGEGKRIRADLTAQGGGADPFYSLTDVYEPVVPQTRN